MKKISFNKFMDIEKKIYFYYQILGKETSFYLDQLDYALTNASLFFLESKSFLLKAFFGRMVIELMAYKNYAEKNNLTFNNIDVQLINHNLNENQVYHFFENQNITYQDIVKKYLSSNMKEIYSLLSLCIHPHYNDLSLFTFKYEDSINQLIKREYSFLNSEKEIDYNQNLFFEDEIASLINSSKIDEYYIKSRNLLVDLLNDYQCYFDEEIGVILSFKCLIEFVAFYFYLMKEDKLTNNLARELLKEHTNAKINYYQNKKYNLDLGYELYNDLCFKSLRRDKFEQEFIKNYLGLNILEKDKPQTYFSLVNHFLNQYFSSEKEIFLNYYMLSQLLSHANNYLYHYRKLNNSKVTKLVRKLINLFIAA